MNVSAPFIRRPVMTTLVMLALLFFGTFAYRNLPVSDLPNVDFPTLLVVAVLPGASAETMAASVATPLERQFSTIAGVSSITSTNTLGSSQIVVQFDLSRDLDGAALDVQSAISAAGGQLPPQMPSPPTFRKVNPADQPILYIAVESETLPLYELDEYAETLLAQNLSMVSGVAQVQVFGSKKFAVRVQIDPVALSARGLAVDDVVRTVQQSNVNLPTGVIDGPDKAFVVQANGQLFKAEGYRPLIVGWHDGAPVRLSDVAEVVDSVENTRTGAWYKNKPAIVLAIQRQPGTNTVAVAQAVHDRLPELTKALPASVGLHILYDRSESINESVDDVKATLVITLVLVVLVIFVFVRSLKATVIPAIALPMSLVGTFAVMWALGFSLDNLSLMALTLSVGFVVDDAIVMLENIVRHLEKGSEARKAAFVGSEEIGFTIVSMTISLTAVFIPMVFLGGIIGRLFREFSITIAVAILLSGFVSLTLTPMLCARFLRPSGQKEPNKLYRLSERGFDWSLGVYEKGLRWTLRHRWVSIVLSLIVLVLSGWLFKILPKDFLPSPDAGQIFIQTLAAQGISFDAMVAHQKEIGRIVGEDPDVEDYMLSVGSGMMQGSNTGVAFVHLKPRGERAGVDAIINRLRPKFAEVPGIESYPQNPPAIRIGGQLTRGLYSFTLQGTDTEALYARSTEMLARVRGLPGLLDVSTDAQLENPELNVRVERDRASALGVTLEQVENALYTAYGSREVSTIYAATNDYKVIVELKPSFQRFPDALSHLYLRASAGGLVPLDAVAEVVPGVGPLTVNHTGQLPSVTISFNLAEGISLGEAVERIENTAREVLPSEISVNFTGQAEAFASSFADLGALLIIAVLVIYLVLGVLYESYLHPVTILSALPFAGFGAFLTLLIFGVSLSIYAFVGIIMLVGLVKKNGIMMVDFAIVRRNEGHPAHDAILEACLLRFRPIMMTTMAALMGTLPIALGVGAGAEVRRPLGLAVVGGLLFSQLLTLFVTPVVYTYLEDWRERWVGRRSTVVS